MMKNVSILLALLVLLVPMALRQSYAQVPDEVESGLNGLIDVGTNLRNLLNLGRSALSDLAHLDIRGAMETMRGFPDNAGQTAGLYLFWINLFLSLVFDIIPILGLIWFIPSILLGISSGYLIYSNSNGLLRLTGLAQMIEAIPVLGLLVFPLFLINLILQPLLIALGRGGSAPGEPIIDRAIELTAPLKVTEGEDFQVSATLNGKPLSGALITLENETVITDSYGIATLRAPDVAEDMNYLIEAGGTEGKGSITILVRDRPGLFEAGQGGSSWFIAMILIVALAVLLGMLVLLSRRRRKT